MVLVVTLYVGPSSSCPKGQSKYGSSCRDVDECVWRPCRYGSTCVNYGDEREYECICPLGFMGKHCDMEAITSATITTSNEFIIAVIACLAALLRMCLRHPANPLRFSISLSLSHAGPVVVSHSIHLELFTMIVILFLP